MVGGLVVNNGEVTDNSALGISTIISDMGSLVKGGGTYDNSPQTRNGGRFQAGNCPGGDTLDNFVIGPGGVSNYVFAIDDATGVAGPNPDANNQLSGWSLVTARDLKWNADADHKLTINLQTLLNPSTPGNDVAGTTDNFDQTQSYSWEAIHYTGTFTGPTSDAALNAFRVLQHRAGSRIRFAAHSPSTWIPAPARLYRDLHAGGVTFALEGCRGRRPPRQPISTRAASRIQSPVLSAGRSTQRVRRCH